MAGLSFGTQGATPNATNWLQKFGYTPAQSSTPAGSALNSAQTGPYRSVVPPQPATPAPTTPVKSTTITHPDGTSIATTYHPDPGLLSSSSSTVPVSPEKSTGTQHPGDVGFIPTAGKPQAPSATAEYDANGQYAGTIGGSTGNNQTPGATTFPGILGALSTASQNGSGTATVAGNGLLQAPQQNKVLGDKAAQIGDQYGHEIANVGQRGAQFEGGQLTTGTSPVASGNAAITAQTTAASQQALASGEAAALQGNAQQLTAQNQAQSGLSNAGSIGNTAQANEQSGLNAAGQLAQPSPTSQGQTVFDPTTGKFIGGSYQNNLSTVVNAIKSGNLGYTDGVNSLSGLSPTAKADVLAALGSGFDTVASDANAATRGSNIQTAGTTGTNIASQGASASTQAYNALNAANSTFDQQADSVMSTLQSTGLNQGVPDYNSAINTLSGKLGSANVQALKTGLTELQVAYTNLLSSNGGTPSAQDSAMLATLNPNSSAAQIAASIQQLQNAAQIKLSSAKALANTYGSQLGGGTGNSGSTASTSGFGWNG